MTKVFCKQCKYRGAGGMTYDCSKNPPIHEDWNERMTRYKRCADKNEDNGCPDFKQKPWWYFWR